MKKIIKLLSVALSFAFALVLFVSCGGGEGNLLDSYLLEKDNTIVNADFTLDKKLTKNEKTYDLTWTSDKENIVITAQEDNYLAKVVRPASGEVYVTLTVKVNSESKNFTVRVVALTASEFAKSFVFAKDKQEVTTGFDLATEAAIGEKKATIAWEVLEESKSKIEIKDNKVVIKSADGTKAFLKATFTYNNETAVKNYWILPTVPTTVEEITVAKALELISALDDNGATVAKYKVTGVISKVSEAYNSQYGNATFEMTDANGTAALTVFRVKFGADNAKFTEAQFAEYIVVGKTVSVLGTLQKYVKDGKTTPETKVAYFVDPNASDEPTPTPAPAGDTKAFTVTAGNSSSVTVDTSAVNHGANKTVQVVFDLKQHASKNGFIQISTITYTFDDDTTLVVSFPLTDQEDSGSYTSHWTGKASGTLVTIDNANSNQSAQYGNESWDHIRVGSKKGASVATISVDLTKAVKSVKIDFLKTESVDLINSAYVKVISK